MKHLKKIIFVVLPLAIWVTMIFLSWNNFKTVLRFNDEYISAVCIELCSSYYCPIAHNKLADSDGSKEARL